MESRRWVNQSLPQTLYIASILLYLRAALMLLFGGLASVLGILIIVGSVAGAYGIANEKRWGYVLGVVVAAIGLLPAALHIAVEGVFALLDLGVLIGLVFPVALFIALIHPQSREYQRIWFT